MTTSALAHATAAAHAPGAPIAASVPDEGLTGIAGWAVSMMESLGGFGAALLIAIENLFPPIPSEIILPLAGFTASQGQTFGLVEVIIWCTAGSVFGAYALYGVGALLGRERTRAIMNWLPLVDVEDVTKTENWFDKHGHWTVLLGRCLPIFRSLISIPAGITRMSLLMFGLLTTIGSLVWNTVLILAGYYLGENWDVVEEYTSWLQYVVIAAVLLLLVWFVVAHLRKRRARAAAGTEAGGESGAAGGDGASARPATIDDTRPTQQDAAASGDARPTRRAGSTSDDGRGPTSTTDPAL
ncbi:DedA family protein [Georgenia sp. Z1491]|uniref:DedA family protein n=1 Tax=Georgenia sp. Z1491 TaxID=3416707 RepID=UPI003CF76335